MKSQLLLTFFILLATCCAAQPADSTAFIVRKVADKIVADAKLGFEGVYNHQDYGSAKEIPDTTEVKFSSSYAAWQYTNGVLNLAMLQLGSYFRETKYTGFALTHIKFGFDNYSWFQSHFKQDRPYTKYPFGELWTMDELDDFGAMGASVIEANQQVKSKAYQAYYEKAANHLLNERLRMDDGTWVRKFPQQNTLWADDLYMGISFLAGMSKYSSDPVYLEEALKQVANFHAYLWNDAKELYYHCYYTNTKRNGVAHWGRCNGWVMLAKTELLKVLPVNHPKRDWLIKNLQQQIIGIAKYQTGNGLWRQVLDKSDSYLETSCTAMFAYCIATAVSNGWLEKQYAGIAIKAWEGIVKNTLTEDGQVKGICVGTSIEDNLPFYYNRPVVTNDKHGTGVFLMAGIAIIELKKLLKK